MKTIFVLFAFGIVFCYGSTVNIFTRNLANTQVPKANFTVTQGSTVLNVVGSLQGQATFNLPTDDVWTLSITKNAFVTFEAPYNFTNAPASIIIPMSSPLNSTTRYRWMLNWVDSAATYDLQLFTPTACVANKTSTCGGNYSVGSASSTGPNYIDLSNDASYNGFYRLGASFATYDSRALIQVVNSSGEISNYIFQSGVSSTSSAGFWHVADYLLCSWGSEITYFNEIATQTFTYPWAYDYCLYQPITISGNVQSNVTNINNVTITFVDTTGAYPNVTVFTGAAASAYTANLRTTTYRVLVSQAGYYTYDNTTTITSSSTTFDIVLNLIPTTTTTTTTSTSTSTSSSTSSSTSGTSGTTSSSSSSSTGAAGTSGAATSSGTTTAAGTTTGTASTSDNNSTSDASTSVATTGTIGSTTAGESAASTLVASMLAVVVAAIVIVL